MTNEIMHPSDSARRRPTTPLALFALAGVAAFTSCGGGSTPEGGLGIGAEPAAGLLNLKPDSTDAFNGGAYIVDEHAKGLAGSVFIEDVYSGRLVSIYDRDDSDPLVTRLVYPDFVIGADVFTEPGRWSLETSPVTGEVRLTIEAKGFPGDSSDSDASTRFDELVQQSQLNLSSVLPKSTVVGSAPPFSMLPRNSALVVQFSDLIDPERISLQNSVRVFTGTPIELPQEVRLFMSPNYGGIQPASGTFYSTRMVVDLTISAQDQQLAAEQSGASLQLNGLGLPPSLDIDQANFGLIFSSNTAPEFGQFTVVRNLSGSTLSSVDNGPTVNGPTLDVVRALRSGGSTDVNNGFLLDLERPSIIGTQAVEVLSVNPASPEDLGDFFVSFRFDSASCSTDPVVGDVITVGETLLEVVSPGASSAGLVSGLAVRLPLGATLESPDDALGGGTFQTAWRDDFISSGVPPACFVRFSPAAGILPAGKVPVNAKLAVRFSEPMDPGNFSAFDNFSLRDIDINTSTSPFRDLVLGQVRPSGDLLEFTFEPSLPLSHPSADKAYFFNMLSEPGTGLRDLAGNALTLALPEVTFTVDGQGQDEVRTDGWVLTFETLDQDGDTNPDGSLDLVGSYLYQSEEGAIVPRPVARFNQVADRTNPIIGPMQAITTGLQTPLSDLGSKMHILYRYADVGLGVSDTDPSFVNIDVEGMALSPLEGSVTPTFYPEFQMRMGHSRAMPDEELNDFNLPIYTDSGFRNQWSFDQNFLEDPNAIVRTVHKRDDGFQVSNLGLFASPVSGTPMLSMPMNQNLPTSEQVTFTWRDTAILGRGGLDATGFSAQNGVPYEREIALFGLDACQGQVYGAEAAGIIHAGVRSIGLPLLMEFSCYPSTAISLNNFDASIALNSDNEPFFRAFSTGGFNSSGNAITKDPDSQVNPTGGFNGNPALPGGIGAGTPGRDPTIYIGQLDLVVRISRVYTVMLDSQQFIPDYTALVQEPAPSTQPSGTSVTFAYRGHEQLSDATPGPDIRITAGETMSVYGDVSYQPLLDSDAMCAPSAGIDETYDPTQPLWMEQLDDLDGLRHAQLRITFVGNLETELTPTLSAVGLAYRY